MTIVLAFVSSIVIGLCVGGGITDYHNIRGTEIPGAGAIHPGHVHSAGTVHTF